MNGTTTPAPRAPLALWPTRETRTALPPVTAHQDVIRDEHLVRVDLAIHELSRFLTQAVTDGGLTDLAILGRNLDATRRATQRGQHATADEHRTLAAEALARLTARMVEAGAGTWHITPEDAEQLGIEIADATEEPWDCADCGDVYALPGNPYCGPCDDAHTLTKGA